MFKKTAVLMAFLFLSSSSLFSQLDQIKEIETKSKLSELLGEYSSFKYLGSYLTKYPEGTSQGAKQFVEEALSVIGEIIIDKATTQAFELIKTQIREQLGQIKYKDQIVFSRSIDTLKGIRLEEVIASGDVLYSPFIEDLSSFVVNKINDLEGTASDKDIEFLLLTLQDIVFQKLKNMQKPLDNLTVELINQHFIDYFINKLKPLVDENKTINFTEDKNQRIICVGLAAYSVWQASMVPPNIEYSDVSIKIELDKVLNKLEGIEDKLKVFIKEHYRDILSMAAKMFNSFKISSKTDIRAALQNACDALFDAVYFINSMTITEPSSLGEPGIDRKYYLYRLRKIVSAAIDKDVNSILRELYSILVKVGTPGNRGVQLLGATLLYAQTYTDPKNKDPKIAHQERTRILSSLVTDRKEQWPGSVVFSFGGSLRGIVGKSIFYPNDNESTKINGPLSVPIGIGADWYWDKSAGVHFDFSVFDLGQYTSFTNGKGEVLTPSLVDVFSPSATVAVFVNPSYPIFLGINFGYCPKYFMTFDGVTKKGFFQWGVTFGIYVPLIDF